MESASLFRESVAEPPVGSRHTASGKHISGGLPIKLKPFKIFDAWPTQQELARHVTSRLDTTRVLSRHDTCHIESSQVKLGQ